MRIATIYTSTNGFLVSQVEESIVNELKDKDVEFFIISNPVLLKHVIEEGNESDACKRELLKMYVKALNYDVDVIYNVCSSVGNIASNFQKTFAEIGVPIIKIDERMAENVVSNYEKIGILATLESTLIPTKMQLEESAKKIKKNICISDVVASGAFGKKGKELEAYLIEKIESFNQEVEVIVLAQASMAICEDAIQRETDKKIVSSPQFGACELNDFNRRK